MPDYSDPSTVDLSISERGETGRSGMSGQANISPDTGGSLSYGILGLNSRSGSAGNFARSYPGLGLTAAPGSADFNAQWRRAAAEQPDALYAAQVDWHGKNIVAPMRSGLLASGVRPEIANDQRVLSYLADRRVQMGDVGWSAAMQLAQGARSPEDYIKAVSANDRANLGTYFRSYLAGRPQDVPGLHNRISLRENMSLNPGASPPGYGAAVAAATPAAGPVSTQQPSGIGAGSPSNPASAPDLGMLNSDRAATKLAQLGQSVIQTPPAPEPMQLGNLLPPLMSRSFARSPAAEQMRARLMQSILQG